MLNALPHQISPLLFVAIISGPTAGGSQLTNEGKGFLVVRKLDLKF